MHEPTQFAEDAEALWDKEDVARFLGVSESWVEKNAHKIPHVKIGRLNRFRPARVREYARAHECAA